MKVILTEDINPLGAMGAVVDVARGIVYDVENIPSWREVHLKTLLEERVQVPVQVNNDVAPAAQLEPKPRDS